MKRTKLYKKAIIALIIFFFVSQGPFLVEAVGMDNFHQIKSNLSTAEIININNAARKELGLKPLVFSADLTRLAKFKIADMQTSHYFDHYSPSNKSLKNFLNDISYNYQYAGENLAKNYNDNNELVQAWLNSPTHRRNMLYPNFDEVGVVFDYVNLNGVDQLVTVMIFGKENI
ncbi:CAP domain-containing protein [Candidatus Parcubacteria bacterium]|nr:hypothetical protein [Patescibacteria group bacterium]MBU4308992.1 hypothetical protein [Patescibacteria group bacterium]MBU4432217.1 hypothetical protein [Patescibacteria group bacterium]MBU4577352.1 hypothetical protein [Patescibacteria group bacterium]MCG2697040.1 CAP domain-containing protein [Candidatus Parcubacteria bacterium]